jgi:hypothetical protein
MKLNTNWKSLLSFLFIVMVFSSSQSFAQKKLGAFKKNSINAGEISTKQVSGKNVQSINKTALKDGYNYLKLKNGNFLYIEYKNKGIKSLVITKPDGLTIVGEIKEWPKDRNFSCNDPLICSCTGDEDCNDMFESGLCGDASICIDNECFCLKSL